MIERSNSMMRLFLDFFSESMAHDEHIFNTFVYLLTYIGLFPLYVLGPFGPKNFLKVSKRMLLG